MNAMQQYIPGSSALHRLDGRVKFFGFLLMSAAAVLSDSVLGYAVIIGASLIFICLSGIKLGVALAPVRRLMSVFVFIFLLNALFYESTEPIASWWVFTISEEGIIQGANILLRIVIIIALSNFLVLTTLPMDIMGSIEALLSPLRIIRVPIEQAAMILSVAVQFIPTLMEEAETIKKAQIARGARFESKKLTERAKSMLPLLVPVFLSAFKRADELSMAMEARGYRDARHRTKKERQPMRVVDWLAIMICAALCALEIYI